MKTQKNIKMKQIVLAFKTEFSNVKGRDPIASEIIDNLKDKIDVNTLTSIIEDINKDEIKDEHNSLTIVNLPV